MQLVSASLLDFRARQNYSLVKKESALGTRTLIWLA